MYNGSSTVPGCDEKVTWIVSDEMSASETQINEIKKRLAKIAGGDNNRALQVNSEKVIRLKDTE